jgi:hypothetical protein
MTLTSPHNLTKTSAIERARKARIIAKFGGERASAARALKNTFWDLKTSYTKSTNITRARKARITAKFGAEAAYEATGAIFKHIPQKQHLFWCQDLIYSQTRKQAAAAEITSQTNKYWPLIGPNKRTKCHKHACLFIGHPATIWTLSHEHDDHHVLYVYIL